MNVTCVVKNVLQLGNLGEEVKEAEKLEISSTETEETGDLVLEGLGPGPLKSCTGGYC